MPAITIKQGASLSLDLAFSNADGTPTDLSGASITAQVRDAVDTEVAALTATLGGLPGHASLVATNTSGWPITALRCDVRVVQAGLTSFSETFQIYVERAVTQ